ncbi:MAG: SusC/RagA family TonB-linked outer membrane protein, partial [Bacteroidales bacterium]|nr:SusC/RagA family TonB-linked outer membrane protein [Bacteroidales bacterium]
MRKQLIILCLLLVSFYTHAQITVKGVVTSATDSEPMIGATVQVKGTYNGTMTGLDGEYELNNVASDGVLIFSTIGYETVEVNISGRNTINVVMEESTELLDELVVVGYGVV